MWIERLKEFKVKSGKTLQNIADETGIARSTIDKIFAEVTKEPPLSNIYKIVHCLGFTLDDLTDDATLYRAEDKELLNRYHSLDNHGKKIVDVVLDVEYERCQEQQEETVKVYRVAQSDDDHPAEIEEMKRSELNRLHSLPMTDEDL